jgi:putative tricarboxylic transport membrane protein
VGDYTMPAVFGSVLILLGLLLLFVVKGEQFKVKYPDRKTMISILSTLGLLFLYWFSIQFLGYEITTFVVGIGLFKVMGSYSWIKAIIFSAILSTVLYFLFIFWLGVPFPTGIFGI